MDTNLIVTLIGLAITVIGGVMVFIINQSSKISELKGRLDTLASENRLQDKIDKIHDESIRKLQQRATELHDTTQTQLDHLATDIVQQPTQVHASLQVLKTQEASSVAVLTERAQQLVQQFQEIEQGVQQLRSTAEVESARLMAEIAQQRAQVKQEIEQEVEALRQEKASSRLASLEVQVDKLKNTRQFWWYQLDEQWQAIFKEAIGINREPTEDELVTILSLTRLSCIDKKLTNLEPLRALTGLRTLNCDNNQLTSLEPLRALTGLQELGCQYNQLTSLEPLRALTGLQKLWCRNNSSLSEQEMERFKKAVPSCKVNKVC